MHSFKPSSALTFTTVLENDKHFRHYCQANKEFPAWCIDLGTVVHCDSAGLAWLIEVKRFSQSAKKTCAIKNIPKTLQALAEFCGLEAIVN